MNVEPVQIEGRRPVGPSLCPGDQDADGCFRLCFPGHRRAGPSLTPAPDGGFEEIPLGAARQAEPARDTLEEVVVAALGSADGIFRLMCHRRLGSKPEAINEVMTRRLGVHRPSTTTVEVVRAGHRSRDRARAAGGCRLPVDNVWVKGT